VGAKACFAPGARYSRYAIDSRLLWYSFGAFGKHGIGDLVETDKKAVI